MSTKKSSPRSAKKKEAPAAVQKQRRTYDKHVLHHHAHVIEQTPRDVSLRERIDVSGFEPGDIHEFVFTDGGVDEVRTLQERVYLKPRGERALYLAAFTTLSNQAQNALLKLLEDPPAHAIIVLGVTSTRSLLETIRSRVHILDDVSESTDLATFSKELLSASLPQRLVLIEPLIEEKDVEAICACIESVLSQVQDIYADDHAVLLNQTRAAVETISYIRMQGAMTKLLLEAWALTLPVRQ